MTDPDPMLYRAATIFRTDAPRRRPARRMRGWIALLITSFSLIQNASDTGNGEALVFFLFDLIHLDGEAISPQPLKDRKERLRALLSEARPPLQFSDHQIGRGRAFYEQACLRAARSRRGGPPGPGEWYPRMPERLDEEELADWRAGRDAVYQLAALTVGARLAVTNG
jgi:hypothetical protein